MDWCQFDNNGIDPTVGLTNQENTMGKGILYLLCVVAGTLITAGAALMYTLVPDTSDAVCTAIGLIGIILAVMGLIGLWND